MGIRMQEYIKKILWWVLFRWLFIVITKFSARRLGFCPYGADVRQHLYRGEIEKAGKQLKFFYGPCKLSHLPDVNHYLAEYYYAIGDEEKHRFHLDKAMRLYNKINDPYGAGMGHLYLIKARDQIGKDTARVIEYCKKGLEISVHEPINIVLHYRLYEAYEETGEYVLSKEHKEKYEEICRDNEPYLYQAGDGEFFHIHDDARKARIPYEKWIKMSDKEQRKALNKKGHFA